MRVGFDTYEALAPAAAEVRGCLAPRAQPRTLYVLGVVLHAAVCVFLVGRAVCGARAAGGRGAEGVLCLGAGGGGAARPPAQGQGRGGRGAHDVMAYPECLVAGGVSCVGERARACVRA